jgi:hypothetical protein
MDAEVKIKWMAALTSGEFNQITGMLESDKGNCCLGVLCRITDTPNNKLTPVSDFTRFIFDIPFWNEGKREFSSMSLVPTGFHGLRQKDIYRLTKLNDQERKTFAEIAAWIWTNL